MKRRSFLIGFFALLSAAVGSVLYAFALEPGLRLRVQKWRITSTKWTSGPLRIGIISDIHTGGPWVTSKRLAAIVDRLNAQSPDLIVFLGDLTASHKYVQTPVPLGVAARELGRLSAPLGVYGILGNHDWWDDPAALARRDGPNIVQNALNEAGIDMLENDGRRIEAPGGPFWLLGLGDQWAFPKRGGGYQGRDDLPATMDLVDDDAPAILLAHEPDIFPHVPARIALTLSGHTHGGQIRIFGYSPRVPSKFGNRYAYGHITESGKDLVVSGGIGCSIIPVRFGVPPEITIVDLA